MIIRGDIRGFNNRSFQIKSKNTYLGSARSRKGTNLRYKSSKLNNFLWQEGSDSPSYLSNRIMDKTLKNL